MPTTLTTTIADNHPTLAPLVSIDPPAQDYIHSQTTGVTNTDHNPPANEPFLQWWWWWHWQWL